MDDLIKVGGIWVAPAEIEHCLVEHPEVVEAAVVGAQDNGLTLARAFVVVRGAVDEDRAPGLRSRASRRTRSARCGSSTTSKTPSGKLDRKALR